MPKANVTGSRESASHELENLMVQMNEAVRLLRENSGSSTNYALVYELRTRLGRIVALLGEGYPNRASLGLVRQIFDEQIQ